MDALTTMDFVFTAAFPKHWCKIPDFLQNLTVSEQKMFAIPRQEDGEYSKCTIYNFTDWNGFEFRGNVSNNFNASDVIECNLWEYDNSLFGNTIVSKWDLVCGKEWIASSAAAIFGFGKLCGSAVGGTLSDRFVRRRILLILLALASTMGVLGAFSPVPHVYLAASFFRGLNIGAYIAGFTLIMEIIGAEWRDTALSIINWGWCFGNILVVIIAYLVRDWFKLDLIIHSFGILLVFLFAWQTPESPRWLLKQNRNQEAMKILKEMAVTNGIKWKDELDKVYVEEDKRTKGTLVELTKSDTMVTITIISCYMWVAATLIFYGLSYNTSNLVGDPYLNFIISGLVEVPAYGLQCLMLPRLGKRRSVFSTFMLSGAALLATIFVPSEYAVVSTVLAMIGKFAATIAFGSLYIYTPEMYPTLYRSTGLGTSSMVARVGGITAPYMALLGKVTSPAIPLIIFGTAALVAGISGLLLPETKKMTLPDTLDEVHKFQENMLSCGKKKRSTDSVSRTEDHSNSDPAARHSLLIKEDGNATADQVL